MKRFGLLFGLIVLLSACAPTVVKTPVESVPEPQLTKVSSEARLDQLDDKIYLVESDHKQLIDPQTLSLGAKEAIKKLVVKLPHAEIYEENAKLVSSSDGTIITHQFQEYKAQTKALIIKTSEQLNVYSDEASLAMSHPFEGEYLLSQVYYVPEILALNQADGSSFKTVKAGTQETSNDIPGKVVLALEDERAFLFQSPQQPNRVGKLNAETGDITWYNLGEGRNQTITQPMLQPDGTILWVFDNNSQAELVFLNLTEPSIKATDLGLTSDLLSLVPTKDGYQIHTKSRIYELKGSAISYVEVAADQVVPTSEGLLGITGNLIQVIKNNQFKDYQLPGKVIDARLAGSNLIVIYQASDSPVLSTIKIDF